jgi:hypothetical protein
MCFSLHLNLLLSLSSYKLAYHYFSNTCWVATISLLTLAIMLLMSWRWDEWLWWRFLLEACVAPGRLPMGWVCSPAARWESWYSIPCKDNISCNNVYIIKTLVFCIHILALCMTTWSCAYIRWASSFGLKTGCDSPLQCRSLDHLADLADTISHRPLVDCHMYTLNVWVSMRQPRCLDEERGLLEPSARSMVRRVLRK